MRVNGDTTLGNRGQTRNSQSWQVDSQGGSSLKFSNSQSLVLLTCSNNSPPETHPMAIIAILPPMEIAFDYLLKASMSNCDCVIPGPSRLKTCVSQLLSPSETQQMRTSLFSLAEKTYNQIGDHWSIEPLALHSSDKLSPPCQASLISGK